MNLTKTVSVFLFRYTQFVLGQIPPGNACDRKFELTLTWEKYAPDGFARDIVLINGQHPGPVLEMNQGDNVEVLVHNKMPFNTTMHFHGIEMLGTPWSDGVPGITQRTIKPGNIFIYTWKATQHGSYWYHAHERGQIEDGFYGAITIHNSEELISKRPYSVFSNSSWGLNSLWKAERETKSLVVSDFQHIPSERVWDIQRASGFGITCYDSILFNGKGSVNCWSQKKIRGLLTDRQASLLAMGNANSYTYKSCFPPEATAYLSPDMSLNISALPPSLFEVCTPTNGTVEIIEITKLRNETEAWFGLNIVGAFSMHSGMFSIDEHPMYIYAVDGSYIEPVLTHAFYLANGARFSIMIKVKKPGDFMMRFASTNEEQMLSGIAKLRVFMDEYEFPSSLKRTERYIDDVGRNTTSDVIFFNESTMKPFPPDRISAVVNQTFILSARMAGTFYNWALNATIFPQAILDGEPILFNPQRGIHNNVTITTSNNSWVDLVFTTGTVPMSRHPIHKHGTKMWLIGEGSGIFNYSSVAEAAVAIPDAFNLVNPPKRDTFTIPDVATGPYWLAVRYHSSNPGAWFVHCHVDSHLNGGMGIVIQDGIDVWPPVPPYYFSYQ